MRLEQVVRIPLVQRLSLIAVAPGPGGGKAPPAARPASIGRHQPGRSAVTSRKAVDGWGLKAVNPGRDGASVQLAGRTAPWLCVAAAIQHPQASVSAMRRRYQGRFELFGERLTPAHPQQVMASMKPALRTQISQEAGSLASRCGRAHKRPQTNKMTSGLWFSTFAHQAQGPSAAIGKSAQAPEAGIHLGPSLSGHSAESPHGPDGVALTSQLESP